MVDPELKNCPFCGAKAAYMENCPMYSMIVWVHCTNCDIRTQTGTYNPYNGHNAQEAYDKVANLWNKRN